MLRYKAVCGIVVVLLLLAGCGSRNAGEAPKGAPALPQGSGQGAGQPGQGQTASPATGGQSGPGQTSPQGSAPPSSASSPDSSASNSLPQVDHIVIVVEENHSFKQIVEGKDAPYMQSLMTSGALFTNAHGITHPSQPNYLALFSGSAQGVTDDACRQPFQAPNLAAELLKARLTFAGYSEDLPKPGFTGCTSKGYARKHNPWVQFRDVPAEMNLPLTEFPKDYSKLPTVSFVIPNHQDDMHDGTVAQADTWLQSNLDGYVNWAKTHRSLLIVTWDEDDFSKENHIPLILAGPMIKPGRYDQNVNHYNVLRTIEELYGLPKLGESSKDEPLKNIWN